MSWWYVQEDRVSSLGIWSGELAKSLILSERIGKGKGLNLRIPDRQCMAGVYWGAVTLAVLTGAEYLEAEVL